MNIDELTLRQIKEIKQLLGTHDAQEPTPDGAAWIGKNVIVRTVTMIYTGRLITVTNDSFVLLECSWIPETERYADFVAEGKVKECEPYPADLPVLINRGAVLDLCELRSELPRTQK